MEVPPQNGVEPHLQDADIIVAVMENQAKEVCNRWDHVWRSHPHQPPPQRQVGLAMLDLSTMHLKLMQVIEPSSSYVHVTTLLASIQPTHVLVVDSAQASSSGLNATTRQLYSHIPVPRAFFDDTKVTLRWIVQMWWCATSTRSTLRFPPQAYAQLHEFVHNTADLTQWQQQHVLTSRYLAVGAAGALLRYATVGAHRRCLKQPNPPNVF